MLGRAMRTSSICKTQHVAARRNRVAKRTQHVAPNIVVLCWVEMLRSFGRGFTLYKVVLTLKSVDKSLVCEHSNESY